MKKIILAACLVALLGSGPVVAQVSFTRYVALGDSLTAGYVGGGLTQFYQERSYPAMLAQAAQASDFQMPLVSAPGIPPILELVSLYPQTVIRPSSDTPGQPINATLVRPYNNLGVPGADIYDLLNTVGDIQNLLAGNQDNVMHDLILRIPAVENPPGSGNYVAFTAIAQAIALDPTFLTLWIGNNDILGAAVYATPIDGVTMTPIANFEAMYAAAMQALTARTTADMVVFTLPDVTAIPFVTTIRPYLDIPGVGRVPLIGSHGLLPEDAYVTLGASSLLAQGIGIPVEIPGGTGIPLPEDLQVIQGQAVPGVVLRSEEIQVINGRISEMNAVIRSTAAQYGVPVVDVNGIFGRIAAGDPWVVGGIELTAQFLVGGIFSYDGVHPQNIGQALIAVELIKVINEFYGAQIPQVNMDEVLCIGGCSDQGPPAFAASKDALFSQEAFQQVLQAFPLRLPGPQSVNPVFNQ
jgi:lysophospholipase L1-like esterase